MTAILGYLLENAVFLASDSGSISVDGNRATDSPLPKIAHPTETTLTAITGFGGAARAVNCLIDEMGGGDTKDEVLRMAELCVQKTFEENHELFSHLTELKPRFRLIIGGIDPSVERGYFAAVDSGDGTKSKEMTSFSTTKPGERIATGSRKELLHTISDAVFDRVSRSHNPIPLDYWASETISQLSDQADEIRMPVTMALLRSDGQLYDDKYSTSNHKPNSPFQATV